MLQVGSAASHELAKDTALQGMILLRNENGALPLRKGKVTAILGPLANATLALVSRYYDAVRSDRSYLIPQWSHTFLTFCEGDTAPRPWRELYLGPQWTLYISSTVGTVKYAAVLNAVWLFGCGETQVCAGQMNTSLPWAKGQCLALR